jgi:hypothetical protein
MTLPQQHLAKGLLMAGALKLLMVLVILMHPVLSRDLDMTPKYLTLNGIRKEKIRKLVLKEPAAAKTNGRIPKPMV